MELYVKDLQAEIPKFEGHGVSKYHLAEEKLTGELAATRYRHALLVLRRVLNAIPCSAGKAELKWLDHPYKGVAVKLDSPGYKVYARCSIYV